MVAGIGDVNSMTEELAQFIGAASELYGFSKRRLIVVGYSNGAKLATSLILCESGDAYVTIS